MAKFDELLNNHYKVAYEEDHFIYFTSEHMFSLLMGRKLSVSFFFSFFFEMVVFMMQHQCYCNNLIGFSVLLCSPVLLLHNDTKLYQVMNKEFGEFYH